MILTLLLLAIMVVWYRGTQLEHKYSTTLRFADYVPNLRSLHDDETLLLLANALSDPVYAAVPGVEYDAAGQLTQPVLWRLKSYGEDVLTCFPMIYRTVRRLKKQTPVPELTGALQQAELLKGSFLVCSAERFLKAGGSDEAAVPVCAVLSGYLRQHW